MMRLFLVPLFLLLVVFQDIYAQKKDSLSKVLLLDSVGIHVYGSKDLLTTASALGLVNAQQLARVADGNILPALNLIPGVSMEERSPGSYRLNIRGSSIRSPYGVRNVKIYYDGIPFTAPGGNSMLNMLGFSHLSAIAIAKGPGASQYGAGTGGVVLFEPVVGDSSMAVKVGANIGSYGSRWYNAQLFLPKQVFSYERYDITGYREHSAMQKRVLSYHGSWQLSRTNLLKANFIYGEIDYQTPGALTLAEYLNNPSASRPAAGNSQSAIAANAGINQKALFLGLNNRYQLNRNFENVSTAYVFYNETKNPSIQNYENKNEPHWGARTVFKYRLNMLEVQTGGELQQGHFTSTVYQNIQGNHGSQLTDDVLNLMQWTGFVQTNWTYRKWLLTVGASLNGLSLNFSRNVKQTAIDADKTFKATLQPRFALLYRIEKSLSAYINVNRGFSPPSSNEVFADNQSLNLALQAETGWNIELGVRGEVADGRMFFDVSYFNIDLKNSIVTRRDAGGSNYYVNAGKARQQGLELAATYKFFKQQALTMDMQVAYSRYRFRYREFIQLGQNFSGNEQPGVAPQVLSGVFDIKHSSGLFGYFTYAYQGKVALNDANSEYAAAYQLLSVKMGYQQRIGKFPIKAFAGADNIFNQSYSLGNDINGFGGRYYNAAAPRTFYMGVQLSWRKN